MRILYGKKIGDSAAADRGIEHHDTFGPKLLVQTLGREGVDGAVRNHNMTGIGALGCLRGVFRACRRTGLGVLWKGRC